jgi:hypothetical protein
MLFASFCLQDPAALLYILGLVEIELEQFNARGRLWWWLRGND